MADAETLLQLVNNPREALSIEVKAWIDPATALGSAKIAKCLLALRNHGGGFLVIGFHNTTLLPVEENRPTDLRATFHADIVQALVSRFASETFEVTVHFPERDGLEFPVIEVPSGVRTPVAAKVDLVDGPATLIRKNVVYMRSLDANGVASTSAAGWKDWPRIMETCFDNREADIGRFLRRHLAGVSGNALDKLVSMLRAPIPEPAPSLIDRLPTVQRAGLDRFRVVSTERHTELPPHGWWEVSVVVSGAPPRANANMRFRDALLSSNPNITGWPVWVDSRNFSTPDFRPYLADDTTWEAFIDRLGQAGGGLDFWRLSSRAEFYLYRAYGDDTLGHRGQPAAMTQFDFGLPIIRTAEALAVGLAFAVTMGASPDSASVGFGFQWSALRGRALTAWAWPNGPDPIRWTG